MPGSDQPTFLMVEECFEHQDGRFLELLSCHEVLADAIQLHRLTTTLFVNKFLRVGGGRGKRGHQDDAENSPFVHEHLARNPVPVPGSGFRKKKGATEVAPNLTRFVVD